MLRTKVVNDSTDLIPLIRAFDNPVKKAVFKEIQVEWKPLSEIKDKYGNNGEQALILDPTMLSLATLRPFQSNLLAKTGDAEKHQMLTELTLQVSNEAAHAIVADLTA